MKEAEDYTKRKNGFIIKTVKCYPGELDSISHSAPEFLCDTGQVS